MAQMLRAIPCLFVVASGLAPAAIPQVVVPVRAPALPSNGATVQAPGVLAGHAAAPVGAAGPATRLLDQPPVAPMRSGLHRPDFKLKDVVGISQPLADATPASSDNLKVSVGALLLAAVTAMAAVSRWRQSHTAGEKTIGSPMDAALTEMTRMDHLECGSASTVAVASLASEHVLPPLRAFENELGVQEPVGFWDPVGFTSDGDVSAYKRRRSVELKHGRISMLATMGYITPEITGKFPGYISNTAGLKFADIPSGLAAIAKVPALGWAQIVAYCGFCELSAGSDDWKTGSPGDYGFKVLTSSDPAEKEKKLAAEIANGRLAMVAIIGMFFQDGLTGSAWGDWATYTDSPLRAFESELGVQAPLGYWDPLGLNKSGDEATFKRRRAVEIKHGRVCMLASIGYIVPEYFKWDAELSPAGGLSFSDVPNGLAALGKLPWQGGAQIVAFCGLIETSGFFSGEAQAIGMMRDSTQANEPGNYGVGFPTFLGKVADPETRKKKLAAEIANGRLAMVAIIGMFFQDGLTGSAWGDWALYTDSPLRAFDGSKEAGATAPLGYWDPCGFSKDRETFLKYRGAELKHGRVAMLSIIGFLGQPVWRFPGYEDCASGINALTSAPASSGFGVLFILVGFFELKILDDLEKGNEPGNFGDPFKLIGTKNGGYDDYWRNFELNNARLAMIGSIGTIVASSYTGLDAYQQWQAAKPVAIDFIKRTLPFAP